MCSARRTFVARHSGDSTPETRPSGGDEPGPFVLHFDHTVYVVPTANHAPLPGRWAPCKKVAGSSTAIGPGRGHLYSSHMRHLDSSGPPICMRCSVAPAARRRQRLAPSPRRRLAVVSAKHGCCHAGERYGWPSGSAFVRADGPGPGVLWHCGGSYHSQLQLVVRYRRPASHNSKITTRR
ncbi:hypothetical protein BDV95DRAFT_124259 [Massariosphaeria phaeospora]|uniref:Uncharacterized protein n=1 Tax=Massariosphaeria phaeospora TaxID=100035 RepID=A0A7C8M8J9_9PLEO|nr:hypothetical protein BDV95DRAFT_124259 [Massariosphaeria phaeospora]